MCIIIKKSVTISTTISQDIRTMPPKTSSHASAVFSQIPRPCFNLHHVSTILTITLGPCASHIDYVASKSHS